MLLFLIAVGTVVAQKLSRSFALDYVANFMNAQSRRGESGQLMRSNTFFKKGGGHEISTSDLMVVCSSDNSMVVSLNDGGGFALVCGSDDQPVIAGYGTCSSASVPSGLADVFKASRWQASSVDNNVRWAEEDGFHLPVAPMVKSVRHQSAPFNLNCPYYIYDDGAVSLDRCLVGCVATATEQVVSHYSYPRVLLDSISGFESANNGSQPTIPAGTKIDFDNILDCYKDGEYTDVQARAVAELSYYLGVACEMSWGVGSSGAKVYRMAEPLKRAFGYKYVRFLEACDYSPRRWFDLLLNELVHRRPIVFAGYSTNGGGHAFVIDGMNADGYFHITWGYGGQYDGYFDLNALTPQEHPLEPTLEGSVLGVGHLQQALFLNPDSVGYVVDDTLTKEHRVGIDSVSFNRLPDTNMFVEACIKVKNFSNADVFSPIELFTYTKVDSTGFPADIDYLGLADGVLPAQSDSTFLAYLHFTETGKRKLGLNTPDSLYLDFAELDVQKAYQPPLSFEMIGCDVTGEEASFKMLVTNMSKHYWSGRKLTYSIFDGEYTTDEGDWRHFSILNLPPGGEVVDSVNFAHLRPNTKYTFVVRNPWNPAFQYSFTTPDLTSVGTVEVKKGKAPSTHPPYRLNHRITIEYNESTGNYRQILRERH